MKLRKFKKVFAVAAVLLLAFSSISTEALFAEENVTKSLTAVLENMEVELTYKEGELPEGAVLNVAATEQTKADTMLEKAKTKVEGNIIDSKTFDVSVKDAQGNDLTLTSPASLTFKNIDMQNISKVFALNGEEIEEVDSEIIEKNVNFAVKNLTSYAFVDVQRATEPIVEGNRDDQKSTTSNLLAAPAINQVSGYPISLKFSSSTSNNGDYKLEVRVYNKENNELLQSLPQTGSYKFTNSNLNVTLSIANNYEIDSVYFDRGEDYARTDVAKTKNKRTLDNNQSLTVRLTEEDDKNYLDIYVKEKNEKVEGSLKISTKLIKGDLSDDDYAYEQKKSFTYQIIDGQGNKIEKQFKYYLYDLNTNQKITENALLTQNNGELTLRCDRYALVDLSSLGLKKDAQYKVKQMNGDRYVTNVRLNNGAEKKANESDLFTINGNESVVAFTNERIPINQLINYDKTAKIYDWNSRTYQVNLMAGYKSNEVTERETADLYFALDVSGSMIYTDAAVTGTDANGKISFADLDISTLYVTKSYSTYGDGITINIEKIRDRIPGAKKGSDGNKYCGINSDSNNKLVFYDSKSSEWKYITVENVSKQNASDYIETLKQEDIANGLYSQRSSVLINSINKFIDGLSDGIGVGIVTFDNDATKISDVMTINGANSKLILKSKVLNCYGKYNSGTKMGSALELINEDSAFVNSARDKYVVAFTDGEDDNKNYANEQANIMKQYASIYTIGVGAGDDFLRRIASTPDQFLASKSISDIYEVLEIISDRIGNAYFLGDITDYIDPRFEVVSKDGTPISIGQQFWNTDDPSISATLLKDDKGIYVKWVKQTVKAINSTEQYSWNATLYLKAKDDFLGGNVVLTNNGATLNASASHMSATLSFPQPSVNVKELSLHAQNYEVTLELGETITPKSYLEKLNANYKNLNVSLTDDELKKLIDDPKASVEKDYVYASDKIGKLVYSLNYVSDDDCEINMNDHQADRVSKIISTNKIPIETYELSVKYIPTSLSERLASVKKDKNPQEGYIAKEMNSISKYDVYVKNGVDVLIDKTANVTDDKAREFTINLNASSLDLSQTSDARPMDIILLLDNSGSMGKSKGETKGKIDILNDSVEKFIKEVKEKSPDSRIAIISFSSTSVDITQGFKDVKSYQYQRLTSGGNTNMNAAMYMAYIDYYKSDNSNRKPNADHAQVLISFTDGENNQGENMINNLPADVQKPSNIKDYNVYDRASICFAKYFKDLGVESYSIGLGSLKDRTIKFLQVIATKAEAPYFSNPVTAADLSSVFDNLAQTIVSRNDIKGVTISDIITKEFKLTEDEIKRLREDGAEVTENSDGTTTVTWSDQTVKYSSDTNNPGWKKDIHVVANDTFLGGNYVPTNVNATLTVKVNGKDYTHEFPKPTVNVGPLDITLGGSYDIVFKGDTITVKDQITKLYDTIKFGSTSINNNDFSSIQLNDSEIAKLLTDGTLTKETYTYKGDGSFGKIVYTLQPNSLEDHKATTASNIGDDGYRIPVETYTLKVEYIPLTTDERLSVITKNEFTAPTNSQQNGASGEGSHKVYVAAGELDLTKEINKQYTDEPKVNANQSFVFKITKYDATDPSKVVDTFYQTISFSANDINNKSKTVKFKGLDKGYYTIEEVTEWSWKYELEDQEDNYSKNTTPNKLIFVGDKVEDKYYGLESNFKITETGQTDYKNVATSKFENHLSTVKNIVNIISDVASAINKFNK